MKFLPILLTLCVITITVGIFSYKSNFFKNSNSPTATEKQIAEYTDATKPNPLSIEAIKNGNYPGSQIIIESELDPGVNYKRYIASYKSDGLKIYGLLSVPSEASQAKKSAAIVFGHGYIPPDQYRTTEKYVAYIDSLARAGYVVFKIDYRGHGNSEGEPTGAYFSPGYTIDTINASQSLRKLNYVDSSKVGAWGHSMAGMIITRILVAKPDEFKAAVIWGGVVGSYEDIMREWWSKRRNTFTPSQRELNSNRPSRQLFINQYGEPRDGNEFWDSISPKTYISNIKTPIELDHGENDETVPVELSEVFANNLRKNNKVVVLNTYPGSNHNIDQDFNLAMQRTIEFFDKYLK